MLVVQMNHRFDPAPRPPPCSARSTSTARRELGFGADMSDGVAGTPLYVHGTVRDLDGKPVAGAVLDVWQADADGAYEAQLDVDEARLRAKYSHPRGRHLLRAHGRPDGLRDPDGRPGRRADRSHRRSATSGPAHVHFLLNAPGYEPLITHLFQEGAQYLDSDVVFGTKAELVVAFEQREPGPTPDGGTSTAPWLLARVRLRAATPRRLTAAPPKNVGGCS